MISLKLAQALKAAGYPQEDDITQLYYFDDGTYIRLPSEFEILDWLEKEKGIDQMILSRNVCIFQSWSVNKVCMELVAEAEGKSRSEAFESACLKILEDKK